MSSPAAIALAVILSLACSRSAAAEVVARVGGTDVTREEILAYVDTLGAQERAALAKDPALLSQVVRSYLARQAVLKEARGKKWDQGASVKAQLDRVREEALIELYLQSVSRPPDGYPSDAEVEVAYQASKKAFEMPRQWRLAQIFVAAAKGDKEAEHKAAARLEDVKAKLRKGADFAAVAGADSDEKSAAQRGGEIGWLSEEQMIPGIRAMVTALAKGAVSEPIRLDDGWHLVKLLDARPGSTRPLGEVRAAISAELRAERTKSARQAYLAKLLEQNPPAINELALSKVIAKPE
jgi:parvulin-like peptidyl-prolyl isomerase